ncbi:PDZ domain-containing protein [Cystobacter fuscus]|nr:PDZ domain-containing protein [Cystobacter fuscus]
MSHRVRLPLALALGLAVLASLLLWSRPAEEGPLEHPAERPPPLAPTAARIPLAGGLASTGEVPRSTPVLETPAAASEGVFVVRVVAEGRPLEGAQVQAYLRGPDDGTGQVRWLRAGAGPTGRDGTLRLPAAPGAYLLSAAAEGHGPARREVDRPAGEVETAVELSLSAAVELRGRVIAAGRGEPVPLAELSLRPYTEALRPTSRAVDVPEETAVTIANAHGHFTFSGLSPGRYALTAEAPGHSRRTVRLVTVPSAGELEVELWSASVLEGFVVGENGQPVEGAEVLALGRTQVPHVTTSATGAFSLEVANGTWLLAARHGERLGRVPGLLSVGPGETRGELRITLGTGSGLTGSVTEAASGAPVPGASLVASPAGEDGEVSRTTADSEGRYTFNLPPGEYDVVALAPRLSRGVRAALVVVPGQRVAVDFQLQAAGILTGVVSDPDGRPVTGAHVRAHGHTARTDSDGTYRLEGLEVGSFPAMARRQDSAHWTIRATSTKAGEITRLDFTLGQTGTVRGQVKQASGAPLSQPVTVRARALESQLRGGEVTYADTDARGRYSLELPAANYQLAALLPGSRITVFREDEPTVTVAAGTAVVQDLTLVDNRGVEGTVLEPSGVPSPNAQVAGIQTGQYAITSTLRADEEGRFAFPPRGANAAPLRLMAHNAGRVGELIEAKEKEESVIRLRPAATLHGKVVSRGGVPQGFLLKLLQEDGSALPWETRQVVERSFTGDSFVLTQAPGLPLRVSVRTTDGRTGEAAVKLEPGQSARVEITLTGGTASISGRAIWSNHAPAENVALYLDKPMAGAADASTGADGRFRLDDVAPGPHTLRLYPLNGIPETRTVTVTSGETVELGDVPVSRSKAASGTVGAGFSEERGWVSVAWLTPQGPAEQAGLLVGDQVLRVDGQVVRSRMEAEQRTVGAPASPIQLSIRRANGQELQFQFARAD